MPVSIVVGGQFGSEGKGKVSLTLAKRLNAMAAVRVGGTNSGHTVVRRDGCVCAFRQLPAAIVDGGIIAVLPAGSYVDVSILMEEIEFLKLDPSQLAVSPFAKVITSEHKQWEIQSDLGGNIGSTQSGTGAAVIAAIARGARRLDLPTVHAKDHPELKRYVRDTTLLLRGLLDKGHRIVIEGTQGFGLSVLHGKDWPKATSRDTTAAAFASEACVSPRDVDDVTLVLRAYPIRVAGESGPLPRETNWQNVSARAGLPSDFRELTTVTKKERRIAEFDSEVVVNAIAANNPSRIVLNHLDYVDPAVRNGSITLEARRFLDFVEAQIGRPIDWAGTSPGELIDLRLNTSVDSERTLGRTFHIH